MKSSITKIVCIIFSILLIQGCAPKLGGDDDDDSKSTTNKAPTADNTSKTTTKNNPITINLASLATDADGDTLKYSISKAAANGEVLLSAANATYSPNIGYIGTDSFQYTVNDGNGNTAIGTVSITISQTENRSPTANSLTQNVVINTPVTIDLTKISSDDDGDALSYFITTSPSKGLSILSIANVIYTPNNGFTGTDTLVYTAVDVKGATGKGTITLNVAAVTTTTAPVVTTTLPVQTSALSLAQVRSSAFTYANKLDSLLTHSGTITATAGSLNPFGVSTIDGVYDRANIFQTNTASLPTQFGDANSATRLTVFAKALGAANSTTYAAWNVSSTSANGGRVVPNIAEITLNTSTGAKFRVNVKDSSGAAKNTGLIRSSLASGTKLQRGIVANSSDSESNSAGVGYYDSAFAGTTVGSTFDFSGAGDNTYIWLDSVIPGDQVVVTALAANGSDLTSTTATVTLADTVPPLVALQSANSAGLVKATSSAALTNRPTLYLTPSIYDSTARRRGGNNVPGEVYDTTSVAAAAANTIPLLANSGGIYYVSGRTAQVYTTADFSAWNAAGTSRRIAVEMTEAIDTTKVDSTGLATVRANLAASNTVASTSTGLTVLSANEANSLLLVTLGDWRRIANGDPLTLTGLVDKAGNSAQSDAELVIYDRTPPMATSLGATDDTLTMLFDQPIATTTSKTMRVYGGSIGTSVTYTFTFSSIGAGNAKVSGVAYIDAYGSNGSAGTGAVATTTDLPVTATVTNTTTTGQLSLKVLPPNPSSAVPVNMKGYFSALSFTATPIGSASSANNNTGTEFRASWEGVADLTGNYWDNIQNTNTVPGLNDLFYCPTLNTGCLYPEIVGFDNSPPKIANYTGSTAGNTTQSGGDALAATRLAIVSVNSSNTELGHVNRVGSSSNDGIWNVNDATSGETYYILITFRENIQTIAQNTAMVVSVINASGSSASYSGVTVTSPASNQMRMQFTHNNTSTVTAGDYLQVSGIKDYAGNTIETFNIVLDSLANGGVLVSKSSVVF